MGSPMAHVKGRTRQMQKVSDVAAFVASEMAVLDEVQRILQLYRERYQGFTRRYRMIALRGT
jgi:NAD(P)H-nitrite reductase large subunit